MLTVCSSALAEGSYAKIDWLGSYVFGNGFQAYENPVFQAEIGHEFKNGFGGSIWGSLPAGLQSIGDNAATEVDVCAWYHYGLATLGISYFSIFPDNGDFHKNDVWQLNGDISKDFNFGSIVVTPGFRAEYNMPVDGTYSQETTGLYLIPRINFSAKLSERWQANVMTKFEGDLGGYGAQKALVILVAPGLTWKISDTLTANASVSMYFPSLAKSSDSRENELVPRIGISKSF